MAYRVELTKAAEKQFAAFEKKMRERLAEALTELEADPRCNGVIKLTKPEMGYRMRVGNVRIKFEIYDAEQRVVVREVVDRREAYRA